MRRSSQSAWLCLEMTGLRTARMAGLVLFVALQVGCERGAVSPPKDAAANNSEASISADIALPVVGGGGVIPLDAQPWIEVTPTEIRVQGRVIPVSVEIPADRSRLWEPYRNLEEILRTVDAPRGRTVVACDRSVPYHVIFHVMGAAQRVWGNHVALAARRSWDDSVVAVPLLFWERRPPPGVLFLIVSYSTSRISLWSVSGREGTPEHPKLVLPHTPDAYRELTAALSPVVAKHFSAGRSADEDFEISLLPAVGSSAQALASIAAAVGATQSGEPLFPRVGLVFSETDW